MATPLDIKLKQFCSNLCGNIIAYKYVLLMCETNDNVSAVTVYILQCSIEAVRNIRALIFGLLPWLASAADLAALLSRAFRLLLRPQILKFARMHEIVVMEY